MIWLLGCVCVAYTAAELYLLTRPKVVELKKNAQGVWVECR